MFAKPALPTFIQIEPVGQCNLSCVMCPVHLRDDGPSGPIPLFMPFEQFMSLLDGFPGLKELRLQGLAEPMMHPRFFDMVSHADQRGIAVSSNGNMTLREKEFVESSLSPASGAGWIRQATGALRLMRRL
ncbi:MAG: radical protein [Nitrospira sp.]|jgi:MoaA/NifB/PqqE/SkfB family radical SAM enzyme|nr:radical protein [Nitrospira sp.]